MGRPPKARTTKKAADAPALVVPSEPSQAKAALKSRVLTKMQALARERTLERATATTEKLRARAKQAKVQAKTRVPAHAKTQERQTRPTRGSVSEWCHWQSKKPDAKAMPPSYRPPKAPSLRPQPPPTPRPPDQKEALGHVDGDQNNSDFDHDVLRQAGSQAGWCHYFLT